MTSHQIRVPILLFLGALLVQGAWILALPQFRGIDEFDHAYRAAAVAAGQWKPDYVPADNGRGDLLVVPRSLVAAAQPVCEWYDYTGPDNCRPVQELEDDKVVIASAAARYNPLFYWVIGKPASWFEGAASLIAMRVAAAVLCAVFIGLAGWCLSAWARSRWPYAGLLVAMSPVAVFSTALAAPNGLEICAGLALWASLLGLSRTGVSPSAQHQLIVAGIPAAMVLALLRQLGPLLLATILFATVVLVGRRRLVALVRSHLRVLGLASGLTAAAVVVNVWWIRTSAALAVEEVTPTTRDLGDAIIANAPLWLMQSIAAFPTRSERAPVLVYAIWLLAFTALVVAAIWVGRSKHRQAILLTMGLGVGVPLALTAMTYAEAGAIWQGRYGLPLTVGIPLLAGLALDDRRPEHRLVPPILAAGAAGILLAHVVGAVNVLDRELRLSPLSRNEAWLMPPYWVIAVLMSVGILTWLLAARTLEPTRSPEVAFVP